MAVEINLTEGKIYIEGAGEICLKTTGPTLQDLSEVQYSNVRRRRDNGAGEMQEDRLLVETDGKIVVTAAEMLGILTPEELAATEIVFKKLFDNCIATADARTKIVNELNAAGASVE